MIPEAAEVRLLPEDRAVLEARLRAPTTEQRDVLRARIILLAAEGTLDTVDCASRRHDAADGEHMAWAVRPGGLGGFGRSAATWPRAQVWRGDGPTHSGGTGKSAAGRVRTVDWAADRGRAGRRARTAGVAFPARAAHRSGRAQIVVRER